MLTGLCVMKACSPLLPTAGLERIPLPSNFLLPICKKKKKNQKKINFCYYNGRASEEGGPEAVCSPLHLSVMVDLQCCVNFCYMAK